MMEDNERIYFDYLSDRMTSELPFLVEAIGYAKAMKELGHILMDSVNDYSITPEQANQISYIAIDALFKQND